MVSKSKTPVALNTVFYERNSDSRIIDLSMRIWYDECLFNRVFAFLLEFNQLIDSFKIFGIENSAVSIFHDKQSLIEQQSTLALFIGWDVIDGISRDRTSLSDYIMLKNILIEFLYIIHLGQYLNY